MVQTLRPYGMDTLRLLTNIPEHLLQALKPKVKVNILPEIAKLTPQKLLEIEQEIKKKLQKNNL